ncbi:Glutathione S-transferase-like protein tpcF [Colletotrichum gloeosporioides]|uniref:Glutathione S-transferase-like protein tpcF n=1 Tax=Colletotrichum gloeosporioides TaxID=474922 RepID=A0A8H4CCL9_COLGL|nr:Glutathione S-transferase-like protein tpcF [Colletotrichum gloeosporioides]KAF3801475.1 Glutathione S-transferase-like protein tpcF [Colletotrichum gloeosporioides]
MGIKTNITLHTEGTLNGLKPTILLAELDLEYKLVTIDIVAQANKKPWFLKINPNGRIPAMSDVDGFGREIRIFESGAILEYLVARYDKDNRTSYPYNSTEYWETVSWLTWQMADVGPMQGQANHFARSAGKEVPYAPSRYVHETRRLYRVLDAHLAQSAFGYIIGDRVTIADIAIWPWVSAYKYSALSTIDDFPQIKKWLYLLLQRPGFEKGRNAPGPHKMDDVSEQELNDIAALLGTWISDAMKRDAAA